MLWLAGELLLIDKCMVKRKRLGFALAYVQLDLSKLLRSRVRVMGLEGPF